MNKLRRPLPWFALALLIAIFPTASAWADLCGDTSGPAGTDKPCACGDTVTSDTVLTADDPVLKGGCFPVGLFVRDVKLDAHLLNPDRLCRDSHPFPPAPDGIITIGLFIVENGAEISHGIIRGCDYGIFGDTDGSRIERVTARDGRLGFFIIGDDNTLTHNICRNNNTLPSNFGGIFVLGNSNTLVRNFCTQNEYAHGITVQGSSNELSHNRGDRNGGHGVFATGGGNITDGTNFGSGNDLKPDCSIDGVGKTPDGRYC